MKCLLFLMTLFSVPISMANTQARISSILMYEQGELVYIYPEGGVQNPPACHGANGDYLSFRLDRPYAKEYLSVLMMAFATQKPVFFRTYGDCVDQSVSDTIMYFQVYN